MTAFTVTDTRRCSSPHFHRRPSQRSAPAAGTNNRDKRLAEFRSVGTTLSLGRRDRKAVLIQLLGEARRYRMANPLSEGQMNPVTNAPYIDLSDAKTFRLVYADVLTLIHEEKQRVLRSGRPQRSGSGDNFEFIIDEMSLLRIWS